jgi:hypothetical protein
VKLELERTYLQFIFGYELDTKSFSEANGGISTRIGPSDKEGIDELTFSGDREHVNPAVEKVQKLYDDMVLCISV